MRNRLSSFLAKQISRSPWTNVYGTARSLLALGTALTLIANSASSLFRPAVNIPAGPACSGVAAPSFFCQFPIEELEWARWLAVAILLVIASGWRPRITGILHWYVSYSLISSSVLVDGGDHVTAVLTFFLVPITLADNRTWHWTPRPGAPDSIREQIRRLVAVPALWVIRVQVAIIYLHASVGKMGGEEWADGTVVYYWFTHPVFGLQDWMQWFALPALHNPLIVSFITWGAILFELFLFMALIMPHRWRKRFLVMGMVFHAGIAIVHGLVSFMLAMWAALILFLQPVGEPLSVPKRLRSLVSSWTSSVPPSTSVSTSSGATPSSNSDSAPTPEKQPALQSSSTAP